MSQTGPAFGRWGGGEMRYRCTHTTVLRFTCACAAAWLLRATGTPSTAHAQPAAPQDEKDASTEPDPENESEPPAAPAETSAGPLEAGATALGVEVEGKMEAGERPTPPQGEADEPKAEIITGAGAGSDVAYASQFVVELGGSMAFTRRNGITMVRLAQVIGWFIIDNLEISLLPDLLVIRVDGKTDVAAGVSLEPSYHVPLGKQVLLFGGVGLGVHFAGGVEFVTRPRIGVDLLIGRSGLLKPALFIEVGTGNGLSAGGLELGYTIML